MTLLNKLFEMRDLGLIGFEHEETGDAKKPVGEIKETGLWPKIRVAFGGMSLSEAAMLSRHSKGMAVAPVFGRPQPALSDQKIDVFVLMPFKAKLEKVYSNHIKRMCEELGVRIRRADEIFSPKPFMEKVWDGICTAQLVLADCTEKNPNVFYEIGMAHTVGKRVVLITRSDKDIRASLGRAGQETIRARYSIEANAPRLMDILAGLDVPRERAIERTRGRAKER